MIQRVYLIIVVFDSWPFQIFYILLVDKFRNQYPNLHVLVFWFNFCYNYCGCQVSSCTNMNLGFDFFLFDAILLVMYCLDRVEIGFKNDKYNYELSEFLPQWHFLSGYKMDFKKEF